AFKQWRNEFETAEFILEDNKYYCGWAIEKMSKSMYNVVNPDDIIEQYGADTLRIYEMFLGPLELSKPWDTNGIDGVSRFLRKLWRLFYDKESFVVSEEAPTEAELKTLHKTIKKVSEDIERFSFNTSVSAFMICVNELSDLKCNKRAILEPLLIILNPFAPHITEELWSALGHKSSIVDEKWASWDDKYLIESMIEYPVSFNGKVRFKISIDAQATPQDVERIVLANENTKKFMQDSKPKKIIVVPKKIINIVI
ncbi:MAG TPA: class I tRNA ligase family protein, partial [Salinivirgaceae bacterium]|nr:class I tRNA ligase family protein [Salinivirgaceae bacterium]